MSSIRFAVASEIPIRPDVLVADWNTDEETSSVGLAVAKPVGQDLIVDWLDSAVFVVEQVGLGVAANSVYDAVRRLLMKKRGVRVRIEEIDGPNGKIQVIVPDE